VWVTGPRQLGLPVTVLDVPAGVAGVAASSPSVAAGGVCVVGGAEWNVHRNESGEEELKRLVAEVDRKLDAVEESRGRLHRDLILGVRVPEILRARDRARERRSVGQRAVLRTHAPPVESTSEHDAQAHLSPSHTHDNSNACVVAATNSLSKRRGANAQQQKVFRAQMLALSAVQGARRREFTCVQSHHACIDHQLASMRSGHCVWEYSVEFFVSLT